LQLLSDAMASIWLFQEQNPLWREHLRLQYEHDLISSIRTILDIDPLERRTDAKIEAAKQLIFQMEAARRPMPQPEWCGMNENLGLQHLTFVNYFFAGLILTSNLYPNGTLPEGVVQVQISGNYYDVVLFNFKVVE
jgi:hypothetical protein